MSESGIVEHINHHSTKFSATAALATSIVLSVSRRTFKLISLDQEKLFTALIQFQTGTPSDSQIGSLIAFFDDEQLVV